MAPEYSRPSWPLGIFQSACAKVTGESNLAVVVLTGCLNPVHIGHIKMLRHAKERLESAGYVVLAGWLSPAEEQFVKAKADDRFVPPLSTEMRLRAAELATQAVENDFLSVGSWQAGVKGRTVSPREVMGNLQKCLSTNFKGRPIRVFGVCGSADKRRFVDVRSDEWQGVVMVPQGDNMEPSVEDPQKQIFMASPIDQLCTSTRLMLALRCGDDSFVQRVVPGYASRLLLDPSAAERADLQADYTLLDDAARAVPGPFPMKKFSRRLETALRKGGCQSPAVIIADGAMSLTHKGHVRMMWQAKERLERAGITVLGAWLSPHGDDAAAAEAEAKGAPELSTAFRQHVAELSVCDDDLISIGYLGSDHTGNVAPVEVLNSLQREITDRFAGTFRGQGASFKVFYVCGMDVGEKKSTKRGINFDNMHGIVCVPRGDDCYLEEPLKMSFLADPDPTVESLSSTKLRADLAGGNVAGATAAMEAAAARFVLALTPAEKQKFQADFEWLGAKALETDIPALRRKLKRCFAASVGEAATLKPEDISRILNALDPSWTTQEFSSLQKHLGSRAKEGGVITTDDFIDGLMELCK